MSATIARDLRTQTISGLLDSIEKTTPLTHDEASRLRSALHEIPESSLPEISRTLLEKLGIETRFQPAIAYLVLARRFPSLIPKMLGDTLAKGLRNLLSAARVSSETAQRIDEFVADFAAGESKSRLLPNDIEVTTASEHRSSRPVPPALPGRPPTPPMMEYSVTFGSSKGTLRFSSEFGSGWSWEHGREGWRSLTDLSFSDLGQLESALARALEVSPDPVVSQVQKKPGRDRAVLELLMGLRRAKMTKEEQLEKKLLHGVGKIEDRETLELLARRRTIEEPEKRRNHWTTRREG